jgi:hypothetical protein
MDTSFGDRVRVRETPDSSEHGLVGMVGDVMGFTTPSVTGITVIGQNEDYAINVRFSGDENDYWFGRDVLEFVDHSPGTKITIGAKSFVRSADGSWQELRR